MEQALARVWREGQKKVCYIYRLFAAGTIEEKMLQRQMSKDGLASSLVTETGDDSEVQLKNSFSMKELKDLMTLQESASTTHDSLRCPRCYPDLEREPLEDITDGARDLAARMAALPPPAKGFVEQSADFDENDMVTWGHHFEVSTVPDECLVTAAQPAKAGDRALISFAMHCHVEFTAEQIAEMERAELGVAKAREKENLAEVTAAERKAKRAKLERQKAQLEAGQEVESEDDADDPDYEEEDDEDDE